MGTHDLSKFHIIGKSQVMLDLASRVRAAAPQWDTILITGERGTGKELLAKAIHSLGPSKSGDLVVVDCAALHPATVESALFGHERGAFTGAINKKIGFLEIAQGGSVFIDEIGTLPLDIQGRFLRFLEERTVIRIGSSQPVSIHSRVIAATNRSLDKEAQNGRFLPDLYDRLNVLHIETPPLRHRGDDILLLAEQFLKNSHYERLTCDARDFLCEYSFPGNVRELRNLCRRLMVFHPQGPIDRRVLEDLLQSSLIKPEITECQRVAHDIGIT